MSHEQIIQKTIEWIESHLHEQMSARGYSACRRVFEIPLSQDFSICGWDVCHFLHSEETLRKRSGCLAAYRPSDLRYCAALPI